MTFIKDAWLIILTQFCNINNWFLRFHQSRFARFATGWGLEIRNNISSKTVVQKWKFSLISQIRRYDFHRTRTGFWIWEDWGVIMSRGLQLSLQLRYGGQFFVWDIYSDLYESAYPPEVMLGCWEKTFRQNVRKTKLSKSQKEGTPHFYLLIKSSGVKYGTAGHYDPPVLVGLKWFESYLFYLFYNGLSLDMKTSITCGFPQWSVLGPLLFLIYNDLANISDKL